jgi:hypothetical protein
VAGAAVAIALVSLPALWLILVAGFLVDVWLIGGRRSLTTVDRGSLASGRREAPIAPAADVLASDRPGRNER